MCSSLFALSFCCMSEVKKTDLGSAEVKLDGAIRERVLSEDEARRLKEGEELPPDHLGHHLRPIVDDTTKTFLRVLESPVSTEPRQKIPLEDKEDYDCEF